MMIVTQDGRKIVNTDHLAAIRVRVPDLPAPEYGESEEDLGPVTIYGDVAVDYEWEYTLGEYPTEERAQEVLQEIAEKYGSYIKVDGGPLLTMDAYVQPLLFTPPKVYTMPPAQPAGHKQEEKE